MLPAVITIAETVVTSLALSEFLDIIDNMIGFIFDSEDNSYQLAASESSQVIGELRKIRLHLEAITGETLADQLYG
jgi:hypothetical protein